MYRTGKGFTKRVRFNDGFHDGANQSIRERSGSPCIRYGILYSHFDKVYMSGHNAGYYSERAGTYDGNTSDSAWKEYFKK